MQTVEYGDPSARIVLLQMSEEREEEFIKNEVRIISEKSPVPFRLTALMTSDWNKDLSPWEAPAVFGKEGFAGGADKTLEEVRRICTGKDLTYIIGGYSLAGLFAIWAAYKTDIFAGVAAASPSVWFPDFTEYMMQNTIHTDFVYLSLGDREDKTKNPVMSTVKERILQARDILEKNGIGCTLEFNPGNHFKDPDMRMAKAYLSVLEKINLK